MKFYLFLVLLLSISGCTIHTERENAKLVVCTTSIIADCMREIMGSEFQIVSLMGPGVDPHSYNPRPSDVNLLNKAKVIIYNGFHLEGKMAELFERLKRRKNVIAISDYFSKAKRIFASETTVDPHIWFRSSAWSEALIKMYPKLCTYFPTQKKDSNSRLNLFRSEIMKTSTELKMKLSEVPRSQRVLITSHDAFHYFSKEFDIEVKALQGVSTTQEPGVRDVMVLVDFIVKRKINALFVEHSVSPKAIQSVINSCKRLGHNIVIGGTLYSDALGEKGSKADTYIKMLTYNVNTIAIALKNK